MSLWNEGCTILTETETDKEITTAARTDGGAAIVCHEPIHTPEEEAEILSDFALACAHMMCHGKDLSDIRHIRVVCSDDL